MSMSPEEEIIVQLESELAELKVKYAKFVAQQNIVKHSYRNFWANVADAVRVCRCSAKTKFTKILEDERKLIP